MPKEQRIQLMTTCVLKNTPEYLTFLDLRVVDILLLPLPWTVFTADVFYTVIIQGHLQEIGPGMLALVVSQD